MSAPKISHTDTQETVQQLGTHQQTEASSSEALVEFSRSVNIETKKQQERAAKYMHHPNDQGQISVPSMDSLGLSSPESVKLSPIKHEHQQDQSTKKPHNGEDLPDSPGSDVSGSPFDGPPDTKQCAQRTNIEDIESYAQRLPQAHRTALGQQLTTQLAHAADEDDCLSVKSAESSTTLVSTFSGLTMVELAGATDELQKVFQEDPELVRLYRQAIKNAAIGSERLQRNLGRLVKLFAGNLRREAKQELEKATCRFVSMKARYIAHCIVEELNDTRLEQVPRLTGVRQLDDDQHEIEDPDELVPVDEDIFDNLVTLREFLVGSAAYQAFREELSKFVLPKELQTSLHDDSTRNLTPSSPLTKNWQASQVIRVVKAVLLMMGCLEPPLQSGMSRLRWQCVGCKAIGQYLMKADMSQKCGDTFFEDVTEYQAGCISELVTEIQPSCANITVVAHGEAGSQQAVRSGFFF